MNTLKSVLLIAVFISSTVTGYSVQLTTSFDNFSDISLTRFTSDLSGVVFIWLPNEDGFQQAEFDMGQQIRKYGEIWYPDLFESHFLPVIPSSLNKIPATDIASLIQTAAIKGNKIILIGSGRGILPLLTGTHLWQTQNTLEQNLAGIILISPNFFQETPQPGDPAQFLEITAKTNQPIFILQPKLSPWFWKLTHSTEELAKGGSDVYLRVLPNVRDRFYYRPDASQSENKLARTFSQNIVQAAKLLLDLPYKTRKPLIYNISSLTNSAKKKERKLRPYKGKPDAPTLNLPNLNNIIINLKDYKGQVVLVNFWASWCPPCVHEMPSMQRLQNAFSAKTFTILGVNMAEDPSTINNFLSQKVNVTFPILLDSDGAALKRWQVFAFPTSYVIDKEGRIRYALFGSVEWDKAEVVEIIKNLIKE